MEAALQEFEFLKDLEQREGVLPADLTADIKAFKDDYIEHDGLIMSAVVPDLLQVSKQRWSQLKKKYEFWNKQYFEKTWYSKKQLEAFYLVDRKDGRPGHDVGKILKSLLKEAKN